MLEVDDKGAVELWPEPEDDSEDGKDSWPPTQVCPKVAAAGVNDGDTRVLKNGCRSTSVEILDTVSISWPGQCSRVLLFLFPG